MKFRLTISPLLVAKRTRKTVGAWRFISGASGFSSSARFSALNCGFGVESTRFSGSRERSSACPPLITECTLRILANVGQRVAIQNHEVDQLALFEGAQFVQLAAGDGPVLRATTIAWAGVVPQLHRALITPVVPMPWLWLSGLG